MEWRSNELVREVFGILALASIACRELTPDAWPDWIDNHITAFGTVSFCCWLICNDVRDQENMLKFILTPALAIVIILGIARSLGVF